MKFAAMESTQTVLAHDLTGRPFLRPAREFETEHAIEWGEGQGFRMGPLDSNRIHRFILNWPKLRLWFWIWGGK